MGPEVPRSDYPRKVPAHLCNLGTSPGRLCPLLQVSVLGFLSPGVGQGRSLLDLATQASKSYLRFPASSKMLRTGTGEGLGGGRMGMGWGLELKSHRSLGRGRC